MTNALSLGFDVSKWRLSTISFADALLPMSMYLWLLPHGHSQCSLSSSVCTKTQFFIDLNGSKKSLSPARACYPARSCTACRTSSTLHRARALCPRAALGWRGCTRASALARYCFRIFLKKKSYRIIFIFAFHAMHSIKAFQIF